MAQFDLAMFFLFFLAKNIPDPSYCRELLLCIACFRSSHRFLVGFRTGLWLESSDIYLVMLFMAASMVSVCLVLFYKFRETSCSWWCYCVSLHFFCSFMMALIVFHGTSNALEIILYPIETMCALEAKKILHKQLRFVRIDVSCMMITFLW